MSVSYEWVDDILIVAAEGKFHPSDVAEEVEKALADSDASVPVSALFDVRCAKVYPSMEDMISISPAIAAIRPKISDKIATVVSSRLQSGIARMAAVWLDTKGFELGIYKDLDEAKAWLREGE